MLIFITFSCKFVQWKKKVNLSNNFRQQSKFEEKHSKEMFRKFKYSNIQEFIPIKLHQKAYQNCPVDYRHAIWRTGKRLRCCLCQFTTFAGLVKRTKWLCYGKSTQIFKCQPHFDRFVVYAKLTSHKLFSFVVNWFNSFSSILLA